MSEKYHSDPIYREQYLMHQREKVTCAGCGAVVSKAGYAKHLKSDAHYNNLRENDEDKTKIENERADVERIYNKKIRGVVRKKESESARIDRRIRELINMR